MHRLCRTALTVAAGGVALGVLLGQAADPVMKRPPEPAWSPAARTPHDGASQNAAMLADFEPFPDRDSYAPPFANEILTDWEPDYPSWTYSDFSDDAVEGEQPEPSIEALPLPPEELSPLATEAEQVSAARPDNLGPLY